MAMRIYVSNEEAAFFNNNKMGYADSIPTSGSYKVGDFIISSTQLDGIFGWVCTEEGTPGKWEVIGSGASGGGKLVSINASKVIDTAVNQISLTELGLAVDSKDKLMVHFNSMFLMEGIDYQISADGSMITKLGGGNWNESNIAGCLFTFELLKNVENIDTEEIKLDSKLICEKNNVTVTEAVSEVNIGISGFNKSKDTLIVYKNATYLIEGVDYEVSSDSSKIVSLNGVWNESAESDYIFTFVVFKEVATINPEAVVDTTNIVDGSVTMDKLSSDVKQAIENASNIDLSGYAVKVDVGDKSQLQTTAKDNLVDAINELFQSANNGKELIATAIGEPLNSSDTFSAMSNGINGLLSTFKTNMMNNGVAVESGDKFKQLIEKLALLSDSEGKGIKFAEINLGSIKVPQSGWGSFTNTYVYNNLNIDFTPTLIFVHLPLFFKHIVSNIAPQVSHATAGLSCIENVTDTSFTLKVTSGLSSDITVPDVMLYAIGVGEEDTTLEDSLKSILSSKGISVTEEDDLASLISKVDSIPLAQGNAVEANVLSGKTFTNADGVLRTGTIANRGGAQTITPGTSNKTLNSGYYSGNITVKGDSNLVAANIVKGKSIFGISGSVIKSNAPAWFAGYNYFIPGASLTTGQYPAVCYYNGGAFVMGGSSSTSANKFYNFTTNKFTTYTNIATATFGSAAVANTSGGIHLIGSYNATRTIHQYFDIATNAWSTKAASTISTGYGVNGAERVGNNIHVMALSNYTIYNISTDTWTSQSGYKCANRYSAMTMLNNIIYVGGGYKTSSNYSNEFYSLDPSTATWTQLANLPYTDRTPVFAASGSYIYAFYYGDNSEMLIYRYSISGNTWTKLSLTNAGNTSFRTVTNNNHIYLFGGTNSSKVEVFITQP